MRVEAYKTPLIKEGDSLLDLIDLTFAHLQEKDLLVITSKVVSVCEGRVIPKEKIDKQTLVEQEAEAFLPAIENICITIKNGFLIPSAGIDESNAEGGYILYPKDIQRSAST